VAGAAGAASAAAVAVAAAAAVAAAVVEAEERSESALRRGGSAVGAASDSARAKQLTSGDRDEKAVNSRKASSYGGQFRDTSETLPSPFREGSRLHAQRSRL